MKDNSYKILRIIFLTLAIISLVFTLCKKVGLCAELGDTIPFPVDDNTFIPRFNYSPIMDNVDAQINLVADLNSEFSDYLVFFNNSNNPSSLTVYVREGSGAFGVYAFDAFLSGSSDNFACVGVPYDITIGSDGHILSSSRSPYGQGFYYQNFGNTVNNISIVLGSVNPHVPVYCPNPVTLVNAYGNETGTMVITSGVIESGGGNIDIDYVQEIISGTSEFSSEVSGIIDNLPSDTSNKSVLDWLRNIFTVIGGGFSGLFRSLFNFLQPFLQGFLDFFSNIYDKIVDFASDVADSFSNVVTTITSFFNSVKRVFDWFYEHGQDSDHQFDFMILYHYLFDFDSETALTAFQNNKYGDFILDVRDLGSTIYNSISGVTASDRVFFTIPLSDKLGGVNIGDITIDFSWYSSIRDTFLPYFMAFLYVSAIWLFFKRLPDIIHGAASAESSFIDSLPEHAETSHGLFTKGVSHNQPSLDKSPLSGGGGVHSGSSQFWY